MSKTKNLNEVKIEKKPTWVIEESFYGSCWEGESTSSSRILGADTNKERLIERWNKYCEEQEQRVRDEYSELPDNGHMRQCLLKDLGMSPQKLERDESGVYRAQRQGSTGGGYASASYHYTISELKQFDQ